MSKDYEHEVRHSLNEKKTRLEKFDVCEHCYCYGILDTQCVCSYGKYKTIQLEFEVCACCGHLVNDGQPADTEFNKEQLNKNK